MRLSNSVLTSVALATVASSLVVPSIEDLGLMVVMDDKLEEGPRNVVVLSPGNKQPQASTFSNGATDEAPVFSVASQGKPVIPHRYMIVFNEGVSADEISFHKELIFATQAAAANELYEQDPENPFFISAWSHGLSEGGILHDFDIEGLISGYAGYFLDSTIEILRKSPLVKFIEQDSVVHANGFDVENGAPWGLARISHRDPLNLGSFNKYLYDDKGGEGVTSYIIDTGVLDTHNEFEGRAKLIADIPNDGALDGNGHGTHCSGTIGSKTYGVAKKVTIRGVKVLGANGSGTMSDVVKGVEVAAKDHIQRTKDGKNSKGASANMSLGGGKSPSLDLAVNAAVKSGLNFAVAAGNENQDACNTSPASAESAITVGASTISDARAYFSNYGKCVDIFAPGLNILSTYIGSNSATATLSGTSMASPHVAGLLAYYLSLLPSSKSSFDSASKITPAQLKKNLISYGSSGVLSDVGEGSPNVLAYNGAGGDLTEFWADNATEDVKKFSLDNLKSELEALAESLL